MTSFIFSACENNLEEVNSLSAKEKILEEATNVTLYISEGGQLSAKLVGPTMLSSSEDTVVTIFPNKLHVDCYDSLGKITSQISAHYGRYNQTVGLVYLKDSVVIFNTKGDTLRSQDLWYDEIKGKIYTENDVEITDINGITYGKGLESDAELKHRTIFNSRGYRDVQDADK